RLKSNTKESAFRSVMPKAEVAPAFTLVRERRVHQMKKIVCLTLLIAGLGTLVQAVAQAPIQLSPGRQIRKQVDAWPLIINPKDDAQRKIDGYLTNLNVQLTRSLKECHTNYVEQMGHTHSLPRKGDEGAEAWNQKRKVTMVGPEFLSLVASTDFY